MKVTGPPEHFNFAEDVLGKWAAESPRKTALVSVDESGMETRWSFGLIEEDSSRLAHVLAANGLARGQVVLMMIADLPYRAIAQLAIMKAGGISLLLRPRSSAREVSQHISRSTAHLVIAGPDDAGQFPADQRVLEIPSPELERDLRSASPRFDSLRLRNHEPAQLVLTGGTTGLPKMVLHTHASKPFYYLRWTVSFDPDDLSWDFGGRWWMGAWRTGTPVFYRAMPVDAGPALILETLARYPITKLFAPARVYSQLVRLDLQAYKLPALRTCWSSGQALDTAVFRAWSKATGITLYDRYNQSEIGESPVLPVATGEPGCIGRPFPWIDMAIIDSQGDRVPAGELGDIAVKAKPVRPPWLFREYWRDPERTAARHRGDWYLTGDVGRADDAGLFFLAGRADDIINCGGENIGPAELESVLLEHGAVREAAVVGTPHPDLGEVPKAFVVPEPGFAPAGELAGEILRFVNDAVHPQKGLREVVFTSSLPRTADGKIRRADLRQQQASLSVPEKDSSQGRASAD
jgi:acetyl-CoA synthetase/medium-chain acyl-CoA synthetase